MRRALRQNPQKRPVAICAPIPPPVGGWNARDALASMSPQDAPLLDNYVPRAGYVELRRGFVSQVTGFSDPVETLLPYRGGATGSDQLFAASGGGIYDVSTANAPLGAALISGFTSNRWNYLAFANSHGAWTIACNGSEAPIGYDGATWAALPALTGAGPPTLDPTKLFNLMSHKGRLFYLEKDSLRVWFPAAGAVGGACGLLDLTSVFSKGGRLVCAENWSSQFGQSADDFAVFMTDQGQVAVYGGIDPADASDWSLVGVFDLGPPLGPRALVKYGGDLVVLTADGVIPLSQGLKLDREEQVKVALTNKILNAFTQAAKAYGANLGWQGLLYPGTATSNLTDAAGGSLAIFNIPTETLGVSMQFVQNVLTGAWARFTGITAFCWEILNGAPYFGADTGVYQWDQGANDNGVPIVASVCGAFSAYGQPGRFKSFSAIRPLLKASALVQPALDICTDYAITTPTAVPTVIGQGNASKVTRYEWTGASGDGVVGAPTMQINLIGDTSLPLLQVNDGGDLLDITGSGDNLLVQSALPFDVPCELHGFDVLYEPGDLMA